MSFGLTTSRWRRDNGTGTTGDFRRGDWICPSCQFHNLASRVGCFRCSKILELSAEDSNQTLSFSQTRSCPRPSRPDAEVMSHTVNLEEGLACSRWAPRNSRGHHNSTQVWTRTTQLPKPTSTSTSISISISTSTSSNSTPRGSFYPDLGLPYEVQHFILETMRRILEEGSYQFASRVVPHLLSDRGWTCSELVELSMWRDTLPNAVSSAVLNMNSSYSLQRALIDAVRVRNAATHRHLCNNFELRKMAKQAEELMRIYGDIGRRLKFECLREELEEWDGVKAGGDEKRRTLETALKSISDRPMETMDWTPNSLSLEEITIDEHEVYVADEMEIDEIL